MAASPSPGARTRENRTRYVVLGMLATAGPVTGYALRKRIAGSVGHFWHESYGQLYPALRQLADEGLVQGRATRGGPGRPGAVWEITRRGREELARWLARPPAIEPQRNELLLKVFFGGAVPPEVTARNLEFVAGHLRGGLAGLEAIAAHWREETRGLPDASYWRLTLDFGLAFTRTALRWLDDAQRVVRAHGGRGARRRPPFAAQHSSPRAAARTGETP